LASPLLFSWTEPRAEALAATTLQSESSLPYPFVALNTADLSAAQIKQSIALGVSLGITAVDFHLGSSANGVHERDGVAQAVQSVGRSTLTLITKLDKPPSTMTDPEAAAALAQQTLDDEFEALGISYLDVLLLKDSATCAVMQAQWRVAEAALAAGRARALGTYNYCEFSLDCLLANATVPPTYNFIMRHAGMGPDATGLIALNTEHGIRTVTYGTVGEPVALQEVLTSSALQTIAEAHERSVEAVALKWNAQSGYAISNRITDDYAPDNVPNGTSHCTDNCRTTLTDMAQLGSWSLSADEMATIDELSFSAYPQSPTYYSSAGCAHSFAVSEHPTESACNISATRSSSWC